MKVRRMSGASQEQFVTALGCPCAPSPEPVLKPFPREGFPYSGCGWDGVAVGILLAWQP